MAIEKLSRTVRDLADSITGKSSTNPKKKSEPKREPSDINKAQRIRFVRAMAGIRDEPGIKKIGLDRATCEHLDSLEGPTRVMIPESWREDFGVTTWMGAYRNAACRTRLRTLFSKDRKTNLPD